MVNQPSPSARKVLAIVGRYRIVTRPVLSVLLGSQASADKHAAALQEAGLLAANKSLPQRRVAYQLTPKGVAALGLSPARARRIGMQALIKHLGLLLLCTDPEHWCERVETEELARTLNSGAIPDSSYCLIHSKRGVRVAIAYVPAPETPVRTAVRRIGKLGSIIRKTGAFERLRVARRIGVLVVTDRPDRQAAIEAGVRRPLPGNKRPVIRQVRVWVRCVPELARCLGSAGPAAAKRSKSSPADQGLFDADDEVSCGGLFDRVPSADVPELNATPTTRSAITEVPGERPKRLVQKGVQHEQRQQQQHQG